MKLGLFKNSILNESTEPLDYYTPVSFLVWLNQQNILDFDINNIFDAYKNYILDWSKYKNVTEIESNNIIRDSYIQVLREVVINFSTEEERRFILNADFTDSTDLDIILPFFIKKIKNICLFYANSREEVKTASLQHNLRGGNLGVQNLVKKLIFDAARTNQIDYSRLTCSFPPVTAIARGLTVYVEELFDNTDTYFNNNPLSANTNFQKDSSLRRELSSSNLNQTYPSLYIDFKTAIIDAIKQYPFFISSLGINNFSINPLLSGTELNYLKPRDFISYLSGGTEELKINLLKTLAPKFMGTNFYYLSTGSTITNIASGILFNTKSSSSSPTLNFLNKQYPATATVPNLNSLFTEYQLGRFFLPQHTGLLIHNTPYKKYEIDINNLQPNSVYAFPDPEVIGNVSYGSNTDEIFVPLLYKIDLTWNKISRSNQFAFGDVLSNSYNPLYYGYQSQAQDLQRDNSGLSRVEDNIQFWTGERQEVWGNSDIWKGLSVRDELPFNERQSSLLVNTFTPVYWGSDIFGNEYGVLKNIFPLKTLSAINYNDTSVLPGSNTVILSSEQFNVKSLYERKYITPGIFYFRGIDSTVLPASAALSAVFLKYPKDIQQEMSSSVLYFNMYYDTFVLETENYVVIDSVNYDYDLNKIIINNSTGFYIKKVFTNTKLEKFIGEWYSEKDNTLYVAFTNLLPYLSSSNYKVLYPAIYKTPLTFVNVEQVYPSASSPISINAYSLSAGFIDPPQINLTEINGLSFTKSQKKGLFNIAYLAKNLNGIPFFVNEQLKEGDWDIFLETFNPRLFRPYYFVYDNNYSNPLMPYIVKYTGPVGGTMGGQFLKKGFIDIGFESDPGELTYLYADGTRAVQINKPGTFVIQFDWQSYNEVTIFVGCSSYNVKNVGSNIIFNVGTPDAVIFDTYGEINSSMISFGSYINTLTGVSAIFSAPVFTSNIKGISSNTSYSLISTNNISKNLLTTIPQQYGDYTKWVVSYFNNITYQDLLESLDQQGTVKCFVVNTFYKPNTGSDYLLEVSPATSSLDSSSGIAYFYPMAPFLTEYTQIKCDIERPTYPDASSLKFTLTPSRSADNIQFCTSPNDIYRDLYITRTGAGTGVVISDPFCVDCGNICYQTFPFNTTISLIASANNDSEFTRWVGGPCSLSPYPDCVYTVTNNYNISAVFSIVPKFLVEAISLGYYITPVSSVQVGNVYSTDTFISSPTISSYRYKRYTNVSLSCVAPISGWEFMGWQGGACAGIPDRYTCSFQVTEDQSISAYFVRYYDFVVAVNATTTASDLQNYGKIISITPFDTNKIECSGRTIGGQTGTCTYSFTGTGQLSGVGTKLILSAIPARGYQFKEWRNTPSYTRTLPDDRDGRFINDYRTALDFNPIASDATLSGIFDIGFYTFNVVFSGNGVGWVKSVDPRFVLPDDDYYGIYVDSGDPTTVSNYSLLSGTVLTLYASAYSENTTIALSSREGTTILGVSTYQINMNTDRTLVATFSAGTFFLLNIERYGVTDCGVISSSPVGLNCGPGLGPVCSIILAKGTTAIVEATLPIGCSLSAYFGDGVIYRYAAGPGIKFSPAIVDEFTEGQAFIGTDGSLFLDPTGAPYGTGPNTIISNGEIKVPITTNRIVSAYFY